MRRHLVASLLLAAVAGGSASSGARDPSAPAGAVERAAASALANVRFVPNLGQWHDDVRFAAIGDTAGWLHDDGFTLRFERWAAPDLGAPGEAVAPRAQSGCVVRTRFLGAAPPQFVPGRDVATRQHFFLGDPARWRTDVPSFETVRMRGVLPGIDVDFRPLPHGQRGPFEYDLVLAPGADLGRFVAVCEGVDELRIDAEGRLRALVRTPDGVEELVQQAPVSWQDTPSGSVPLRVHFRLLGANSYGFVADALDPAFAATVDPGVVWGTYLGGGASDSINDLKWKAGAGIWVTGWAGSTDFPTTVGAYRTTGGSDAFVARLQEDGSALVFSTYFGGSLGDEARGLAIGPANSATVVGFTASTDFPITPGALQPTFGGAGAYVAIGDAFVARFDGAGTALLASTYLGGTSDDIAEDVVVDANGDATVVGWTFSADFPTTPGAWRPSFRSIPGIDSDGFATRVTANAQSATWSTFLGGLWSEQMLAVDLEPATGDVVVAGWSLAPDYPTTLNAYRTTNSGDIEGVVTRLVGTGNAAVFSTYIGGVAAETGHDVCFDTDGSVWVVGRSNSPNFPVTLNAPQRQNAGFYDGFVSHLSANGQSLVFSTLLGGPATDSVRAVDVLPGGVVVVGETASGFPVTANPIQAQFAGGSLDGFLSYLTSGGTVLSYSTYLGGTNQDFLDSVQLDGSGMAIVGGWSFSTDFPLQPATLQPQNNGVQDGIVVRIDLLSELGEGFAVAAPPLPPPTVVEPGRHELLAAQVENVTSRDITIESVRLLLAGAGSAPLQAQDVRLWLDLPGAAPVAVAGPIAVPADDAEFAVVLQGALLPAQTTGVLRVDCEVAPPAGGVAELACAVVDGSAWQLHAEGAGPGPEVRVLGTGRAEGPVLLLGALPGDADGDGQWTVVDVRLALQRLGSSDPAIDCDGDAVLTPDDVDLLRAAVLGRPAFAAGPSVVAREQWFTLRGVFGTGLLDATLGGRALVQGRVTPREITLRTDAVQPLGPQVLSVMLGGRRVFLGSVLVQ